VLVACKLIGGLRTGRDTFWYIWYVVESISSLCEGQLPTDLLMMTEAAGAFLAKAGHLFFKLQSANFDHSKNQWVLQFDVGLNNPNVKKLTLDQTGKVLSFE
jgi:hypothetical protein